MTLAELVIRYAAFAGIAMVTNLSVQHIVMWGHSDMLHYVPAFAAGTLVGLLIKYLLDKRWIFQDIGTGKRQHGKKFSIYAFMGIFTTAIYFGSETAFFLIWKNEIARNIGAGLGLTVGYTIKYQLDSRFVFTDALINRRAGKT